MTDFNEIWAAIVRLAVKQARQITDDTQALQVKCLYKTWDKQIGKELQVGEYVQYEGELYKVLQPHTVQETWTPTGAPSLYAKVLVDPTGETILDWVQPDSTNAYMKGDKVKYEGVIYESLMDNNIWCPVDYPAGWAVVN